MPLIEPDGRLFGRFNILDAGVAVLVGLVSLGFLMVQSNLHATSSAMVKGETDIDIRVMFRLRSEDEALIKVGDVTNITVRNQPRGSVQVVAIEKVPVKDFIVINNTAALITPNNEQYVSDYWVTLRDHATITEDGYVAEGVKVKIGLPINLEGFKYSAHGGIVDVLPVEAEPAKESDKK